MRLAEADEARIETAARTTRHIPRASFHISISPGKAPRVNAICNSENSPRASKAQRAFFVFKALRTRAEPPDCEFRNFAVGGSAL
jgi:hypothetical protein